jgi:hypothetical protein
LAERGRNQSRSEDPNGTEQPIERTTVEARGGGRGRLNLRVLVISTAIALVLLAAIYLYFFFPFAGPETTVR